MNLALLKLHLDTKKPVNFLLFMKTPVIVILLYLETPGTMYITYNDL